MSVLEGVPQEQLQRDNPHGTNWKFLEDHPEESGQVKPCMCNGECTNQEPRNMKRCDNCDSSYCSYCHGFRFFQTYVSDEDYWCTYGYKPSDNTWYIWAN